MLEKAFSLDVTDARVFLELDQLRKKRNRTPGERLAEYERYAVGDGAGAGLVHQRDDLMIEYVMLLNSTGRYQDCYDTIMSHTFRPWNIL